MCEARAAYETGRFVAALDILRRVEALQPQAETRTYAYNWLTVTLRKLGREREAMQYGQAALARWRGVRPASRIWRLRCTIWPDWPIREGNGLRWRWRFIQESIPLNPDLSERSASLNNLGLILQAQGDPSRCGKVVAGSDCAEPRA
jgi:tetratricopeptide (TPR) repeat protein